MLHGADRVKRPELVILTGPLAVVVTAPLKVKAVPVNEMPLRVLVLTAPARVVVPLPPIWVREAALIDPRLALPA